MTRRPMTSTRRLRILEANDRVCHLCGGSIDPVRERWDVEHPQALGLGGSDDDDALRPAHVLCHKSKTADDQGRMAKADRQRAKHMGAQKKKSRPMDGSRESRWRKRMDGTAEPR